jgi:hypothetical protein
MAWPLVVLAKMESIAVRSRRDFIFEKKMFLGTE